MGTGPSGVATDGGLTAGMVEAGLRRAFRHSWQGPGRRTVDAYASAVGKPSEVVVGA